MDYFVLKTLIGWLFLILGLAAISSMLSIMGKQEKKTPAPTLRKIHHASGILFFLLMLVNAMLGFRFWVISGDTLSLRAVLHAVLALTLVFVLFLKVVIVKRFKNLLRYAPTLGMITSGLGFVVFLISGGFFTARSLVSAAPASPISETVQVDTAANTASGAALFATKCASCHYADREESLFGPGLRNLMKTDALPTSGRPATEANVKQQIVNPYRAMPAFTGFSEQEMADLISYLNTL